MRFLFFAVILSSVCSLAVSRRALAKRSTDGSPLLGVLSTLLGYNFRDFVSMESKRQLTLLISAAEKNSAVSQYLFARLNNPQRSQILAESNPFERYELFTKYDMVGKGLLLACMSEAEISMILFNHDSEFMTRLMQEADEATRSKIIAGMGPNPLVKWFFDLSKTSIDSLKLYLNENQQKNLLHAFTRLRVCSVYASLNYEFLERVGQIGGYLDELSQFYDRKDLKLILHAFDPILYLSRYTPKERLALKNLMTLQEKRYILHLFQKHKFKSFPDDFFDSDIKNNYLSDGHEWDKFWTDLNHDVKTQIKDGPSLEDLEQGDSKHLGSEFAQLLPNAEEIAAPFLKGLKSILPPKMPLLESEKESIRH